MNRKELRPKALNPKRKVPGWLIAALGIFAVIFCVWAEIGSTASRSLARARNFLLLCPYLPLRRGERAPGSARASQR
jgi:hypothetical protein